MSTRVAPAIAVVGMACRYPDSRSPTELWENALARRRAFRRIVPERLRLEDYAPGAGEEADTTYATHAALLEGWELDRVRFRVGAGSLRAADPAHWLALDVASEALRDAGFPEGEGLPRASTGVLAGNSLTGEVSRAASLRLRFPYVRRVVAAALEEAGSPLEDRRLFLERLEARFKAPFAPPDEETLAGGLSNTIAGRICNHYDLLGGGYTVDGACAGSLLAVTTACSALAAGDLDVALAGGVDVSLDPFELVGFARAGALAKDAMRVFDARPTGFWPGEGAGFAVLMRLDDALGEGRRVYAVIRGWGVSSDGSGGLTRPEVKGQLLALQRAYARAGFGADTVAYFEGHGTGTAVGDATELEALSRARREANPHALPAAIGSIKANIGHAKAAAGIAGLIKAVMALHAQVLPPTTGCESPHAALAGEGAALRVLDDGEPWPADRALRAGVSAMGFGGINAHVALEGVASARRAGFSARERALLSTQDAELFLLGAESGEALLQAVNRLSAVARRLSLSELGDLAASLAARLAVGAEAPRVRAAVVAATPDELASRLGALSAWLGSGEEEHIESAAGAFLSTRVGRPRIGFLFPGQGSPARRRGGALERRFAWVRHLYEGVSLPITGDPASTASAQPAIVAASVAGMETLDRLGISAEIALGHSLGELTALHWAGAMSRETLLRIAHARGAAFADLGAAGGTMAALAASAGDVEALLGESAIAAGSVVVAGLNAPRQTVVSGAAGAIGAVVELASARGIHATRLRVSHAFHSPMMAAAAPRIGELLAAERLDRPLREVVSTVTGERLDPAHDLRDLLIRQVTSPVRFTEAARAAAGRADLFIEVGPGRALEALSGELVCAPVIAIDAGGASLEGLLSAAGAAFVLGAPIDVSALFAGRFNRPFDPEARPRFLTNPCESAPIEIGAEPRRSNSTSVILGQATPDGAPASRRRSAGLWPALEKAGETPADRRQDAGAPSDSPLEVVTRLVAERTELPRSALHPESRLLRDLHLNSISVSQIVIEAQRRLGLPPSSAPIEYAGATLAGIAECLAELARGGGPTPVTAPPGVASWVRSFEIVWVERALRAPAAPRQEGFHLLAPEDHPLRAPLSLRLSPERAGGVIVCLPRDLDERSMALLLRGARLCEAMRAEAPRFVVVHEGEGAAFAKTLHLELPEIAATAVQVPADHPDAARWVLAEAASASGFSEARYDGHGVRCVPVMRCLAAESERGETGTLPIGRGDVLLVTGGGKGIASECALALARETGARLALLGRSRADADPALSANLARMASSGIEIAYLPVDVTNGEAVRAAVRRLEGSLGPVTAILHGAGVNEPALLGSLDEAAFARTLAVKVSGLRNVLSAVDVRHLRAVVAFGSIIGRTGMRGEAHYAVANEALTCFVERFAADHPAVRCLSIEWSVWSGLGMGERLGHMEALIRQGITPIPPEDGIRALTTLLRAERAPVSVVVAGRIGDPPTLEIDRPELPLSRFLERPGVYVPGVELIADCELSSEKDPYLDDHVVSGEPLFPAVMGLEAMAQVAAALMEGAAPAALEDVVFHRPVAVPRGDRVVIRVAALSRAPDRVDVVLRSASTGFQVDHFRATCRFGKDDSVPPDSVSPGGAGGAPPIDLDPRRDLYGTILFHEGRFQRLTAYRRLSATACVAEIAGEVTAAWFGRWLPSRLLLGDPALRDAAMHAIQACVPDALLLPVGLGRLMRWAPAGASPSGAAIVRAHEISREGDTFVYDVSIANTEGALLERWEGLVLRRVGRAAPPPRWPEPLLGPYLERRVRALVPGASLAVAVRVDASAPRPARSDRAIRQAVGAAIDVQRRPDGKPEATSAPVSVAHAGDVTLAVVGAAPLGCDIEPVVVRPASVWSEILGAERHALATLIAREAGEDLSTSATRVWTAHESLRKAGVAHGASLTLDAILEDGWMLFAAGAARVASYVAAVRGGDARLAIAVLSGGCHASV